MAGLTDIAVPFAGTVLKVAVAPGDAVGAGSVLVVLESMKMEHVVEAESAGVIESVRVAVGDAVQSGDVLLSLRGVGGQRIRRSGARGTDRDEGWDPTRAGRAADPGRGHARRGEAGGDRAPARPGAKDGAGEHRGPVRPRQLRGVRRAGHRGPAGASERGGPAGQHAGRRADHRHRAGERRPVRRRRPLRRPLLRLHRPGRHPGPDEPPEEGPALRAGRAAAPAGRALRRGGRRPPRRHRHGVGDRSRHRGLRPVRRPERQGAPGRDRVGPLLRRQRRPVGVLPRHHRHARRQHRDGRPGHDRGRRVGRVRPRGRGPRLGTGAQRGGRRPLRRRDARPSRRPRSTCRTSRGTWPTGRRPTRSGCATSCRPTGAGSTTCTRPSRGWRTRGRCSSCGRRSPRAW